MSLFVKSKNILSLLGLAQIYNVRPSSLLDIQDAYTAFCLDEACAYISTKIKDGEEPTFEYKAKSFKDFYNHLGV